MTSHGDANELVNFCRMVAFAPDSELHRIAEEGRDGDLVETLYEIQQLQLLVTAVLARIGGATGLQISEVRPTLH